MYIYPVFVLKGTAKNIVEICADRSHMDGFRSLGNKKAFYFHSYKQYFFLGPGQGGLKISLVLNTIQVMTTAL